MGRDRSVLVRIHPTLDGLIREVAEKKQISISAASLDVAEMAFNGRKIVRQKTTKAGIIDFGLLDDIKL